MPGQLKLDETWQVFRGAFEKEDRWGSDHTTCRVWTPNESNHTRHIYMKPPVGLKPRHLLANFAYLYNQPLNSMALTTFSIATI